MRGPATLIRLSKKAFVNHRLNIAQGGVLRTMVDLGILLRMSSISGSTEPVRSSSNGRSAWREAEFRGKSKRLVFLVELVGLVDTFSKTNAKVRRTFGVLQILGQKNAKKVRFWVILGWEMMIIWNEAG